MPGLEKTFRLDRVLGSRGYCARSQADDFLRSAEVRFDGERMFDSSRHVAASRVMVNGEPLDPELLYVVLHKPLGHVCSHEDGTAPLIYDLLPRRWRLRSPPLTSAGRLDKDTSGMLVLSDDGQLIHRLTAPKKHVPKVYVVTLRDALKGDEASRFAAGTMLLEGDDRPLRPAEMTATGDRSAELVLHEGRYHQVRKMFAACGNEVVTLHRRQIGGLSLDVVEPGAWRFLSGVDLEMLRGS
jgi:16S rRNA pseudouridine516 synthase